MKYHSNLLKIVIINKGDGIMPVNLKRTKRISNASHLLIGFVLSIFLVTITDVHADSIDGTWCHMQKQKMMTIKGNELIIERFVVTGEYSRHSFTADWPNQMQNDPDAGSRVQMRLIDQRNLRMIKIRPNGENTSPENWHRCEPVT